MNKVRFAEHTTVFVSPAVSPPHTASALVAHGGPSSSSAPSQMIPIVEHVRLDDSDEHFGPQKLMLSVPGGLPSVEELYPTPHIHEQMTAYIMATTTSTLSTMR